MRGLPRSAGDVLLPVRRIAIALRWLLLAHAVLVNAFRLHLAAEPGLLVAATLGMLGWTIVMTSAITHRIEQRGWFLVADMAVTLAAIAMSVPVLGDEMGRTTLGVPGYWSLAAPLTTAMFVGTAPGTACALIVGVATWLLNPSVDPQAWGPSFLAVIIVAGAGALVSQFLRTIAEREETQVKAVALAERERLSRIVHDGALQVLALVERQGPEFGPRGLRLAALARESEAQLRGLLQDREVTHQISDEDTEDLAAALDRYASATVTVSTMAGSVELPRAVVFELEAVLRETLKNSAKHAGEGAQSWVLLEEDGDDVVVWVRDNGAGMTAEDVAEAQKAGRMGIQRSIVGRMRDLGGTAKLKTAPGRGVEWELRMRNESKGP